MGLQWQFWDLQQYHRIKLMRFSCYEWNPKRFHPQFSGIAERFAEHKKRRLEYQERRKQLDSDKAYSIKLNEQMEKQLFSKTLELSRLKQAKQRHIQDLNFKQFLYEKRQEEIQSLRATNNKQRSYLKANIALARKNIKARNQQNHMQLKLQAKINNSKLETILHEKHKQKNMKYQKVKVDQEIGESRIAQFHRQQNEKSFAAYCQRIKHEKRTRTHQIRKIKKYQKQIAMMNQSAQIKKKQLSELEEQISELTSQSRTLSIAVRPHPQRRQLTDGSRRNLANRTHSDISLNSDVDPEFTHAYKHK